MAHKDHDPYAKRMAKIASATPEQIAKMTPKQRAIYQGAVSWLRENGHTLNTAAENPAVSSKEVSSNRIRKGLNLGRGAHSENGTTDETASLVEADIKAAKIAAIRRLTMPKVSGGQMAAFLWMPQLNRSLKAFTFPLALFVQTFAQIFSFIGLLGRDHPARTFEGAKLFRITQVFEEARINLPPVSNLWAGAERILTTRQYAIFVSSIAVLVTGGLSILTMFTQLFFGGAKAFAQNPFNSNISLNFVDSGNLGTAFINAIFNPNGTDAISASLGELFRIYSTIMLVFAGLIVLWILIAIVAESARTGIPMGKQFNHVWAPIRLIAALGLLIPLGSGLNSGQLMVIWLAKWGSSKADEMWLSFAKSSDLGTSGTGTTGAVVNSVLETIPTAKDNYRSVSDNIFDILLCQSLWNQYVDANPGVSGSKIAMKESTIADSGVKNAQGNITLLKADGNYETVDGLYKTKDESGKDISRELVKIVKWQDEASKLDCGTVVFPVTTQPGSDAASIAKWDMLKNQSSDLTTYYNLAGGLANQLAGIVRYATTNSNPDYGIIDMGLADFWQQYDAKNAEAYAAGRLSSLSTSLKSYNQTMGKNLLEEAQKHGWVSAPAWLNKIAEQNGQVLDAANMLPTVYGPAAGTVSSGYHGAKDNPAISGEWNLAMQFISDAGRVANEGVTRSSRTDTSVKLAQESFKQILAPSNNPLGKVASYGRRFMTEGLKMTFASGVSGVCEPEKDADGNIKSGGAACATIRDATPDEIRSGQGSLMYDQALQKMQQDFKKYEGTGFGKLGGSFAPGDTPALVSGNLAGMLKGAGSDIPATMLRPAGTMLVSFGFMAGYVLPLLPFIRFMLGILGWILLLVETILAMPLLALSLLKTDGEGFMTQNFQTGVTMILALILRPALMIFGMLFGIIAFNGILNIANVTFLAAASPDNSLQSVLIYLIIYGMLAYTLANSAFKAIDILPNQVMSWLGARLDQRVDDASVVHQQSAQMVGNIGMVSAMGGGMKMGRSKESEPKGIE